MNRLTVALPVFNGQNFIREALDTILNQTYAAFDLIISDNASTDATEEICRSYADRDSRIRYFRQPENRGGAWNYNYLLSLARTEYFKWMAHDDAHRPTFLERCMQALDSDPTVVLAYSKTVHIDSDSKPLDVYDRDPTLMQSPQPSDRYRAMTDVRPPLGFIRSRFPDCYTIFGVMRTEAVRRAGALPGYAAGDHVLLVRMALLGKYHRVPEPLFCLRCHDQRSVVKAKRKHDNAVWYDPSLRGRILFPDWRLSLEFYRALDAVPLSAAEKTRCMRHLARYMAWNSPRMARDVALAASAAAGRLFSSRAGAAARQP